MSDAVRYVVFPQMHIKDFNAESNQYVAGIPAMTAFTGYGHALERRIQAEKWRLNVEGVVVLLHEMRLHEGHPKCPAASQGAKDFINPPIIEEIKGDMRVTLVFRLTWNKRDREAREWVRDVFDDFKPADWQCLSDWAFSFPCCGGSCQGMGDIALLRDDSKDNVHELQAFLQPILRQDRAYVIRSREDLLQDVQAEGQDALDGLFDTMRVVQDEHGQWKRKQAGWLVPLAVGYQAIEAPQPRQGVRKNARHIYAEPLTGLGELVYASHWLWQADFSLDSVFWVHRHDAQQQTYFVTTLQAEA